MSMLLVNEKSISPDHCKLLVDLFDTAPDHAQFLGEDDTFNERVLFITMLPDEGREIVGRLALDIAFEVGRIFKVKLYPETVAIVKWHRGQSMALHQDGQEENVKHRSAASIIYLNECEGGQIYFPDLGTEVKPKPGTLVAFGKTVQHGIKLIESDRYTLSVWLTDNEKFCRIREGTPLYPEFDE